MPTMRMERPATSQNRTLGPARVRFNSQGPVKSLGEGVETAMTRTYAFALFSICTSVLFAQTDSAKA